MDARNAAPEKHDLKQRAGEEQQRHDDAGLADEVAWAQGSHSSGTCTLFCQR